MVNDNPIRLTPNYSVRKFFTQEQEQALRDYFEKCTLLFYGLTSKDCRKIAYEMAKYNNVGIPPNWERDQMAGSQGFRNDSLICLYASQKIVA